MSVGALAAFSLHRQPLLAVEAEQLLVVQRDALPPQQDVQAPIAEAPTLARKPLQPATQLHVIRPA
jgi:hypothetical protein